MSTQGEGDGKEGRKGVRLLRFYKAESQSYWLRTCRVLQDKEEDPKEDSEIIRVASSVSKGSKIMWVSAGQATSQSPGGSATQSCRGGTVTIKAWGRGYLHIDFAGWGHWSSHGLEHMPVSCRQAKPTLASCPTCCATKQGVGLGAPVGLKVLGFELAWDL